MEIDKLRPDPLLSELATRFTNRAYIADQVLTLGFTPTRSFKWLRFKRATAFANVDTTAVPHAAPPTKRLDAELLDGRCQNHHVSGGVDPSEQAEGQNVGINLQTEEAEDLANTLLLRRELNVASTLRDTSVMTNNKTLVGTGQWSHADSDPLNEIVTAADELDQKPNLLILSQPVLTKLITNKSLRSALNLAGNKMVTIADLLALFMVEEIIVGGAKVNTAKPGQPESLDWVWGKDAILAYRDKRAVSSGTMRRATYGSLVTLSSSGKAEVRMRRWVEAGEGTEEGVTKMKASTDYGVVIQAVTMAKLFKNAVA